ncbi:MAG: zf-TFIIB domain-containing protein [Gammaproteobacteria bacterium]|nr:zf-TFIIB domain-containing protein [Gammaproteobacteria bacterium]
MRCPKCRADMEQIVYEGVEVDRCSICSGIWFDAGEVELLRNKKAAAAIDTGDAAEGKLKNKKDDYPCPRCNGGMVRMVDARQRHIWFETCSTCGGSFFDAGEFVDLSVHSISDFFKSFSTPERK